MVAFENHFVTCLENHAESNTLPENKKRFLFSSGDLKKKPTQIRRAMLVPTYTLQTLEKPVL